MCGIAGILTLNGKPLTDLGERLQSMSRSLIHRGPDDDGLFLSPNSCAGLANRRLAVRDLSTAGHMPMGSTAGTHWITYNGEIYNTAELRRELECAGYIFRSHSDTEVILHGFDAWGPQVVERLRGMFAFAILTLDPYHGKVQQLFLARDRLGIKPLYYAQGEGAFLFASELKALQDSGLLNREISPAGLVGYLTFGSVPTPWTIYQDAKALPPASTLTWQDGQATIQPYWHLPHDTCPALSDRQAVEQVRVLLEESVRLRLVSDVPLGAFLSGGLDSSAVVALMRQSTAGSIRTCAIVFEEAAYSEAPYARIMAEAVNADHYERLITASDLQRELSRILHSMDQPSVDGVNTYFVSQTARQAGLTVALSGLGGDELFGGYPNTFQTAPQVLTALRLAQAIPGGSALATRVLPHTPRWARIDDALRRPASPASAYLACRGLFAPSQVQTLVAPEIWQAAGVTFDPLQHLAGGEPDGQGLFGWVSRTELATYTQHQLLRDTDIMSMGHSLEVRVPLLDHRLVEMVLRLPPHLKRAGHGSKPLLAHAVADLLPPPIRQRRGKQGFTFPFDLWLRSPLLRPQVDALLHQVRALPWLNPQAVTQVTQDFAARRVHWSRLWALLALASVVCESSSLVAREPG